MKQIITVSCIRYFFIAGKREPFPREEISTLFNLLYTGKTYTSKLTPKLKCAR